LGADIIAGFPTETEEAFENSLDLIETCKIAFLHAFPYSPRPGTPAERMPQLEKGVIKARAARLREVGETALARHLARHVGTEGLSLVERGNAGRLPDFTPVRFLDAANTEAGRPVRVRIIGQREGKLEAERL